MTDAPTPTNATVPVTSAWASKINWTQAVAAAAMVVTVATGGKLNITPEEQAAIVVVIGLVSQFATVIMKTWFTSSVHASSLPTK